MSWYGRTGSPNLLSPSLSRRDTNSRGRNHGSDSTISQTDESTSTLGLRYRPTPLPSQMEFPTLTQGLRFESRGDEREDFEEETPRASHRQLDLPTESGYGRQNLFPESGSVSGLARATSALNLRLPRVVRRSGSTIGPSPSTTFLDTSVSRHAGADNETGGLHRTLIRPAYHGPTPRLENPCNCNNIICTLFRCPNEQLMKEPATSSCAPRIYVHMEYWGFHVLGRKSSSTGGIKAVRVGDLINAMHEALHNPITAGELNNIGKHMSGQEMHTTMQKMAAHVYSRTGRYPNPGSLEAFQRIDFIVRNTREPMFLKRPHVASDPALFVVALA